MEIHTSAASTGAPGAHGGTGDASHEAQTIATLRAGDAVDAVFACTRKERLLTRAGDPYLALELGDQGGSVKARAFRDADLLAGRFERGDLVRVRGRAELFREELQLSVQEVARVELSEQDAVRFLPVSRRDLDELEGFYEQLAREVYDPGLAALLGRLLADVLPCGRFLLRPRSGGMTHGTGWRPCLCRPPASNREQAKKLIDALRRLAG